MTGQFLTRSELLSWGSQWSQADVQLIDSLVERLELTSFKQPQRGDYIGCSRASGPYLMTVHPGYLEFNKKHVPAEVKEGETWLALSTFRARNAPVDEVERPAQFCPECFLQLPLTLVCSSCS